MDRLINQVRTYAWGSATAIPDFLGTPATGEPQAELWMGAHPGAPSLVDRGDGPRRLDQIIADNPEYEIGADATERFGARLPFLFKVLAPVVPLSLQVHPDSAQARAGFAAEQARGIPLDAPERNYRDSSHKPELICALGDFEALVGFRDIGGTLKLLSALDVPALRDCAAALRNGPEDVALRAAVTSILTTPHVRRAHVVNQVAEACRRVAAESSPFADVCAAVAEAADIYPGDVGVPAALLLNHVRLRRGEAIFLDAGLPHSYLRGTAVEILANSDNVLRCGLTEKHTDTPELLRILRFRSAPVEVLTPVREAGGEDVYRTPVEDFRLSRVRLDATNPRWTPGTEGPQILLCADGRTELTDGTGQNLALDRGQSVYIRAGAPRPSLTGDAVVFRATTHCTKC